jgi:hypothetical protein
MAVLFVRRKSASIGPVSQDAFPTCLSIEEHEDPSGGAIWTRPFVETLRPYSFYYYADLDKSPAL